MHHRSENIALYLITKRKIIDFGFRNPFSRDYLYLAVERNWNKVIDALLTVDHQWEMSTVQGCDTGVHLAVRQGSKNIRATFFSKVHRLPHF